MYIPLINYHGTFTWGKHIRLPILYSTIHHMQSSPIDIHQKVQAKVHIDLWADCDLACDYCFKHANNKIAVEKMKSKRWVWLSIWQIQEIMQFTKENIPWAAIVFSWIWEPLKDKKLRKALEVARNQSIDTIVYSSLYDENNPNWMLTSDQAELLLHPHSTIIAKKNSIDPIRQDKFVNVEWAGKKMQAWLDKLILTRNSMDGQWKKHGTIGIQTKIDLSTVDELPALLRYWRENDLKLYFDSFMKLWLPKSRVNTITLSQDELVEVFRELIKIDKNEFWIDTVFYKNMRTYGRRPCKNSTKLSIRANGQVFPCISRIKDPLWNIFDKQSISASLTEILHKRLEAIPCCICATTTWDIWDYPPSKWDSCALPPKK